MRIIGGKYRSRRFQVPASFKARPTTDLAKESLFNILENRLDWEETDALDLFAGTGSMGFEMLSRGAKSVLAIEKDFSHYSFIKSVAAKLADPAYRVLKMDALKWVETQGGQEDINKPKFDFIFADPPYSLGNLENIYDIVLGSGILRPEGLLIIEHPKGIDFSNRSRFTELRHYGAVHFSFFSEGGQKGDDFE